MTSGHVPRRALALVAAVALGLSGAGCDDCSAAPAEPGAPPDDAARVVDEATMARRVANAGVRARARARRVLLVFVGASDADSRLLLRLLREEPAASALARGYEAVTVNVGDDRSGQPRLRHLHDVTTVATLVVLDAENGARVARRVFAPASGRGTVTSATLAAWLDDPRGR